LLSGHQITVRLEAFNVLNHKVLGNRVADLSSATFGQITSASGGRNVQTRREVFVLNCGPDVAGAKGRTR